MQAAPLPLLLIILTAVVAGAKAAIPTNGTLSDDYIKHSAEEKQKELFDLVSYNKTSSQFPEEGPRLYHWLFCTNLESIMNLESDIRPPSAGTTKRIHSVGSTAKAKYESIGDHTYTGLFNEGSPHAMVRLSLAAPSDASQTTPGIAVKFFRDGIKSANFMAMYRLEGQEGDQKDNFFLNNFSNHVLPPTELKLKLLSDQFEKVAQSTMVGLSDIAKYTHAGEEVSNVKVPYKLLLIPNQELKEQMNKIVLEEPDASLTEHLSRIDSDTTLYEVHALETPTSEPELIGKLSITSKLTSSAFGDKELFFQHQEM